MAAKVTYQVVRFLDLSTFAVGALVQIWPQGTTLRLLEVSLISPVTQPVDLHFGTTGDGMPTEHGRSYGDDDTVLYSDGVWFSLPSVASAGAQLIVTVYQ